MCCTAVSCVIMCILQVRWRAFSAVLRFCYWGWAVMGVVLDAAVIVSELVASGFVPRERLIVVPYHLQVVHDSEVFLRDRP
jgi:hypothetical protein